MDSKGELVLGMLYLPERGFANDAPRRAAAAMVKTRELRTSGTATGVVREERESRWRRVAY
jgi:hypothetical protein